MKKFVFVSEIIPKRLYFAVCQRNKCPTNTGTQLMLYFNYFVRRIEQCFGPPNIGVLHEYITEMRSMLAKHPDKTIIHMAFTDEKETTTNSMFLIGGFAIVDLGYDPITVSNLVIAKDLIAPFQDTTGSACQNPIPLDFFFKSLYKAVYVEKFVNFNNFNINEFDYALHGMDISWILPDKFLAFSNLDPQVDVASKRYQKIIDYFKKNNVTTIVRLNEAAYNPQIFIGCGLQFHDLFFPDCTAPSLQLVKRFLEIAECAQGVVAVHCLAGLGRTGTLIAAYMIKHYTMTAYDATAWCRLCRYGSIVSQQFAFLKKHERVLKMFGLEYKRENNHQQNHVVKRPVYGYYLPEHHQPPPQQKQTCVCPEVK